MNETKKVSLEEYKLEKNMRVVNILLDEVSRITGREIEFKDCFQVVIKDGKIYTEIEIPEYVPFQRDDVTDFVMEFLTKEILSELSSHIIESEGINNES